MGFRNWVASIGKLTASSAQRECSAVTKRIRSSIRGPFREPQVLEGEDAVLYQQLFDRMCAAVMPVNILEEMLGADVVAHEWEFLRLRRWKWRLILSQALAALKSFLGEQLDYEMYAVEFEDTLAEILLEDAPEGEADALQRLAEQCARNDPAADEKVNEILAGMELSMEGVVDMAREAKAEELVQRYGRRERRAAKLIQKVLTRAGRSMDDFMAEAFNDKLDDIERIDRLAAIAESRRNASLGEIDRRRAILGASLRQKVQEIEEGEFKLIEKNTPAN